MKWEKETFLTDAIKRNMLEIERLQNKMNLNITNTSKKQYKLKAQMEKFKKELREIKAINQAKK